MYMCGIISHRLYLFYIQIYTYIHIYIYIYILHFHSENNVLEHDKFRRLQFILTFMLLNLGICYILSITHLPFPG